MTREARESCSAFWEPLAHRLRYVRCEHLGEDGVAEPAALIKVSPRIWSACEACELCSDDQPPSAAWT